jgi:Domain of unknown function (DUF4214)
VRAFHPILRWSPPPLAIRALLTSSMVSLALLVTAASATAADPAADLATDPAPDPIAGPGEHHDLALTTAGTMIGPISTATARYIADTYQVLLGRAADGTGIGYNLARLVAGGDRTREAFAYGLAFSPEGSRREVVWAYRDLLGRAPDEAGADYWTAHLQGHGVVDLRVLLAASDEYHNRAGATAAGWIESLYEDLLGRPVDSTGWSYWQEQTQAGLPRALVAASIYQSDESLGRRVEALYTDVLGRPASAGERVEGVDFVRANDERNLRARLVGSNEAYAPYITEALVTEALVTDALVTEALVSS